MEKDTTSWFSKLKSEFNKVTWPTKQETIKKTVSVVISSIVIGCLVALMDFVIRIGVENLVNFPGK